MNNLLKNKFVCSDEKRDELLKVINKYRGQQGCLMPVLHKAQEIFGYLPVEVQKIIAEELDIPLCDVYGVVTFYSHFSVKPKGKYKISVCLGTACYVKGSNTVLDKIKQHFNMDVGECTDDGKFSIEATRCIGACGLAPVIMVNDDVYGKVTEAELDKIWAKYE